MSTLSQRKPAPAAPPITEEKRKALQQYRDDDGHFSLVRWVGNTISLTAATFASPT